MKILHSFSVMKVAKKIADKSLNYAISITDEFQAELAEFGHESATSDKTIIAIRSADGGKFVMKDEFK